MAILPVLSLLYAVFALSMAAELKVVEKRVSCDSGWSAHGNRCFKLFTDPKTWSEAEGQCASLGGHLASIHNELEAKFVGQLTWNSGGTWIGGGGSSLGFVWYWTDGSAFDYSNWAAWEPNNWKGNEHCALINFGSPGVWNDETCHKQFPYVCAK